MGRGNDRDGGVERGKNEMEGTKDTDGGVNS